MRTTPALQFTAMLLVLLCTVGRAEQHAGPIASPAEQKIAQARRAIEANSNDYQAHNALAWALARRARETSDPVYYHQADVAIREALRLMPGNLESEQVGIWVLLGQHEFAKALDRARALNKKVPDDVLVYGFITDACVELGSYEEAEKAAQWMLDMRPGNVPGLTRAAYLRELFGDIDGALELMQTSYQRTPPQEVEDRAWILNQIGHLQLMQGKVEEAEQALQEALALFPGYHYALGNLAKVRTAQGRLEAAIELQRQRYQSAPHPENLFALGQALHRAGRLHEASAAWAEFEQKARGEMEKTDNSNRELVVYYVDYARKPAEALRVARKEVAHRHDVYTLDVYAWALYANGEYAEARRQIATALTVGIRDADLYYHAGAIAAKSRDRKAATRYLEQAIQLAPKSDPAAAARKVLERL